jgi:apolipoprotein N-acyltransferase
VSALPDLDASGGSRARRRGLGMRFVMAAVAGLAVGLSWQPYGFWPLLLVGLPAFTLAVSGAEPARAPRLSNSAPATIPGLSKGHASRALSRAKDIGSRALSLWAGSDSVTLRQSFVLGYVFGFVMLAVTINWVHVLGVWIALILIAFESLFFGLLGMALHLTSRLRAWPLAAACCWVMIEFAYSRIPFGGFGWTRLAYAAVDTPLAGFLPIIGVAGVSFLVALIGQVPAWVVVGSGAKGSRAGRRLAAAAVGSVVLVVTGLGLTSLRPQPAMAGESVNVGIVQGNVPGRGIEALGRMRSVTNNHLSETVNLIARSRLGEEAIPDFILWPENSTDIDPTKDQITLRTVQAAAEIAGRPILVGAVMAGPGEDERQTSALWWDPERGITARYDKRNLVPFGEWIPFRDQLLPLLPILHEVGAQSISGTEPGVMRVALDNRTIAIGDVICFELAYDKTVYSALTGGAQLLLVQSNNATYGGTGQIEQQFAITRARALEARREIAVATTNGVSGLIDARGRIVVRTDEFTAASTVVAMPLRSQITPAVRLAPWIDRLLAAAGLLCCVLAAAGARGLGSRRRQPVGQDGPDISPDSETAEAPVTASR